MNTKNYNPMMTNTTRVHIWAMTKIGHKNIDSFLKYGPCKYKDYSFP